MLEAAGFVKGWLEARGIEAEEDEVRGLPVLKAEVGPGGRADGRPARAPRRRSRPGGTVRPAGRGRPALRARRLRHEGGAGGDAADHRLDARPGPGAGAARDRRRRGVRGGTRARQRPPRRRRLRRRLRDHRRADRPADRRRGEGGARPAARGRRRRRPRRDALAGRQRGAEGASTFSAASSRYRLPGRARSCSTAPRSTSAGFSGGDALNKVPDRCAIDVDIRYLPEQDPATVLEQVRGIPDAEVRDPVQPPAGGRRPQLAVRPGAARGGRGSTTTRGSR